MAHWPPAADSTANFQCVLKFGRSVPELHSETRNPSWPISRGKAAKQAQKPSQGAGYLKQAPKNSTTAEFQIGVVLCETKTATDTSRLPRFPERPHLRRSVAKPTREPPQPTSRGSTLNKQGSLTSKFSAGQPTPVLKLQLAPAVATLRAAPRICVLDKPPRSFHRGTSHRICYPHFG